RILSRNNFGFDKNSLKESFAHNFYNQKLELDYNENVFVRYLSLTSFMLNTDFNVKNLAFKQDIFSVDENLKQLLNNKLKLDKNEKNILIHVGSSVENKIYPKTKLAILCKLLINEFQQAKIWLAWGNVKEYEFAKEVLNLSGIDETHIELAPKFNLEELMAFTKMMDLIIGNDSGPTHLAFALNKASITIFGATPSYRNAFQTHINKIIDAGKKIQNTKHIDKSDFCITRIEEEDIFKLAKGLLNEK
ncbi:TPA: glycosyltransferase family 9 protein, partial [Campylobacter jejuni]|nr:glycosyltransferase family 9 protein [Campylobacter jejuni]